MTEQSLALIQEWMKSVITERGDLVEKLDSAAPHAVPTASCWSSSSGSSGCSDRLGSQSQDNSPMRSWTRCSAASWDIPRAR